MEALLIDDHQLVNMGLASCLEETERFSIAGQASTLAEAVRFIEQAYEGSSCELPALIILDIMLGEENGLDFLPFLKNFCREKDITMPAVIVCSVLEDPILIQKALELGASGYVPKSGSKADMLDAIDKALHGEVYISETYHDKLNEASGIYAKLTKRELEVYYLLKQNMTNRQIAKELNKNIRTIENYVSNIYFKMGIKSRLDLLKR
jgi:NarL family two-component system response regulator LiaR